MNEPLEQPSKNTRKWSLYSFACNLLAAAVAACAYSMKSVWSILLVDLFVLVGLALFFKACFEFFQLRTWDAFLALLPALVMELVVFIALALVCWFFLTVPDSATS